MTSTSEAETDAEVVNVDKEEPKIQVQKVEVEEKEDSSEISELLNKAERFANAAIQKKTDDDNIDKESEGKET